MARKPGVVAYLAALLRARLSGPMAVKAVHRLDALMGSGDSRVALEAAKEVLARSGVVAPPQRGSGAAEVKVVIDLSAVQPRRPTDATSSGEGAVPALHSCKAGTRKSGNHGGEESRDGPAAG
jgi:hypothetical protein